MEAEVLEREEVEALGMGAYMGVAKVNINALLGKYYHHFHYFSRRLNHPNGTSHLLMI